MVTVKRTWTRREAEWQKAVGWDFVACKLGVLVSDNHTRCVCAALLLCQPHLVPLSDHSNVFLANQPNMDAAEKSFQKQPVFNASKGTRRTTRDKRWYKDVGLGFKVSKQFWESQKKNKADGSSG